MCQANAISQQVLDALKAVSETYHASHERRVGHELQVVIACLAFFAAGVATRLSTGFDTSSATFLPCVCAAFLALCCIATTYLATSAGSNKLDLAKARAADSDILDYLNQVPCSAIRQCLTSQGNQRPSPSQNRWIWEVIIVWSGALLAAFLMITG